MRDGGAGGGACPLGSRHRGGITVPGALPPGISLSSSHGRQCRGPQAASSYEAPGAPSGPPTRRGLPLGLLLQATPWW